MMILNPNCSEMVQRLDIQVEILNLTDEEIDCLEKFVCDELDGYDDCKEYFLIYNNGIDVLEKLKRLPFFDLLEQEEVSSYEYC